MGNSKMQLPIILAITFVLVAIVKSKPTEDCTTAKDCPKDKPWCCDKGFCATGPAECGDGECVSDADCLPGQCCSIWGYCGTDPNFCPTTTTTTTTTTTLKTTTGFNECHSLADCPANKPWCCDEDFCVADPADCGDGECTIDADCPPSAPCCSKWGYCGTDPQYCD